MAPSAIFSSYSQSKMARRCTNATILATSLLSRPQHHSDAFSTVSLAASEIITKNNDDAFTKLIQSATGILTSSDTSENEIEHSYGSASQGQWICSKAAGEMQRDVLEKMCLKQVNIVRDY